MSDVQGYERRNFELKAPFAPTGDQPAAIAKLLDGVKQGKQVQVVLGATGTGKTFTDANVIAALNRPTLVMVHNKTLASQLYGEFKELFPNNRVEYFISNFDFYQPEAYIPKTDTYIDKNAVMNEEIDMMRTSAMNSVLSRSDTIVVASVAAIYGLSDPAEYQGLIFEIRQGEELDRKGLYRQLLEAQYTRNNLELKPGTFRVRGDVIDIAPATHDYYIRIDCFGDEVESIAQVDSITGEVQRTFSTYPIFPAYDHASTRARIEKACKSIQEELEDRLAYFRKEGKLLEAERLEMRTRQDIESMLEFGRCPGIENYSRHIDGRKEGQRPYTLMDYMPKDFLLLVDESHVTFPQIRGMYNGDRARKMTLVEYGFRLPSALDNRPLNFQEFESLMPSTVICTSATPGDYEMDRCGHEVVEQIIRPTGLLDPEISVRPSEGQIDDLLFEIKDRIAKGERVMIVTLTIKMAEDLTSFLKDRGIKVTYLHNETKTLERTEIIYQLRKGKYDVLVGINLLREGLDIPEVSLIAILDADKEGFLRSTRSLIQIIGRAARNAHGKVVMYADVVSDSMKEAIEETNRRRSIQQAYNEENGIVPTTIIKPITQPLHNTGDESLALAEQNGAKLSQKELERRVADLEKQMKSAAKAYDFERAAELRDLLFEARAELEER
ncbi:MAG TPA: excinuclease ABC subunit B [Firmicutes bacterium]|nr:excinuclease ABC subunit B [Bacillota bacterium]